MELTPTAAAKMAKYMIVMVYAGISHFISSLYLKALRLIDIGKLFETALSMQRCTMRVCVCVCLHILHDIDVFF